MAAKYDWLNIKKEYVTGKITYEELSEKHGIRFKTLAERAASEEWVKEREKYREEVEKISLQKEAKKNAKKMNKVRKKVYEVSDKLLDKIFVMADMVCKASDLKSLTSALSDIQRINGIKSEADQREQEARIDLTLNQIERNMSIGPQTVNVVITGAEEYAE